MQTVHQQAPSRRIQQKATAKEKVDKVNTEDPKAERKARYKP